MIGIQDSDSPTPCVFVYSCFCCVRNDSVSVFLKMGVDSLVLGGTDSGAIVLFGQSETLKPIALLCGHSQKVTDILPGIEPDKFFSVSQDGSLMVWSSLDYTCIGVYSQICDRGDIKLKNCPWNVNLVIAYSIGKAATIYDLENKRILARIVIPGLTDFTCIGENKFISVSNIAIVRWTLDPLQRKFERSEIKEIALNIQLTRKLTDSGILEVSPFSITFRREETTFVMDFTDKLEDGDELLNVVWTPGGFGVVSKFGVCFNCAKTDEQTWDVTWKHIPEEPCLYSCFTYNPRQGFIVSNQKREVVAISSGNTTKFVPFGKNWMKVCQCETCLKQVEPTKVVDKNTGEVFESTTSNITAIASRRAKQSPGVRTVMTGSEDGSMLLFQHGFQPRVIDMLASPIEAFVFVGHTDLNDSVLVIGSDGLCSLFTHGCSVVPLKTRMMKVMAVYSVPFNEVFVIESEDMSFLAYHLSNGELECSMCVLPVGAKEIWRRTSFQPAQRERSAYINGMTITYKTIELDAISNELTIGDDMEALYKITCSETEQSYRSLVLLGCNGTPTFAYPGFFLCGTVLYQISPAVLVKCLVYHRTLEWKKQTLYQDPAKFKELITNEYIPFEWFDCLPEILKVFVRVSRPIQVLCARICIDFAKDLSAAWIQRNISRFIGSDIKSMPVDQLFLLACVVVSHSQFVTKSNQEFLLSFLEKDISDSSSTRILSCFLLLHGLSEWAAIRDRTQIIELIIRGLLMDGSTHVLIPLLAETINKDPPLYLSVIKQAMTVTFERKDEPLLRREISFVADMSKYLDEPTQITVLLVPFANDPLFKEARLLDDLIVSQEMKYKSLARFGEILMFGMRSGFVYVFIKNTERFSGKVLDGAIDFVSISPDMSAAVACSFSAQQMATFAIDIKKARFSKRKVRLLSKATVEFANTDQISINWSDPTHPEVEYVSVPSVCE